MYLVNCFANLAHRRSGPCIGALCILAHSPWGLLGWPLSPPPSLFFFRMRERKREEREVEEL